MIPVKVKYFHKPTFKINEKFTFIFLIYNLPSKSYLIIAEIMMLISFILQAENDAIGQELQNQLDAAG